MSVTEISTNSALIAARELRAMMRGRVVLRGDDGYARARQIWNRAVENQPALLAVCETSEDVQAAVLIAQRYNLPLSVRGGGHDWTGRALCSELLETITRILIWWCRWKMARRGHQTTLLTRTRRTYGAMVRKEFAFRSASHACIRTAEARSSLKNRLLAAWALKRQGNAKTYAHVMSGDDERAVEWSTN